MRRKWSKTKLDSCFDEKKLYDSSLLTSNMYLTSPKLVFQIDSVADEVERQKSRNDMVNFCFKFVCARYDFSVHSTAMKLEAVTAGFHIRRSWSITLRCHCSWCCQGIWCPHGTP